MKAELKEVEAKKQAHGRAQLDKAKAKAQREWLSNGGDLAAFEQAWPAMEAQILQDKTLAAVNGTARQPIIRSL